MMGEHACGFARPVSRCIAAGFLAVVAFIPSVQAQERVWKWYGDQVNSYFGFDCSSGGDISGDGVPDFIVAAPSEFTDLGVITAFSGADGSPIWQLIGGAGESLSSPIVMDDIDGDGTRDFLVRTLNPIGGQSLGWGVIAYSGATRIPIYSILGNTNDRLGLADRKVGDLDGDGIGDFTIRRAGTNDLLVCSGAIGSIIYTIAGPSESGNFGESIDGGIDIDHDGVPDLLIGDSTAIPGNKHRGEAWLYSGATGVLITSFVGIKNYGNFGASVAFVHDVNSDGIPDLAIGASGEHFYPENWGHVHVYSGADFTEVLDIRSPQNRDQGVGYGDRVADAGDLNHDGFGDLLVRQAWGGEGEDDHDSHSLVRVISGRDGSEMSHYFDFDANCPGMGDPLYVVPDLDGDGSPEFFTGSYLDSIPDGTNDHEGSASVWRLDDLFIDPLPSVVDVGVPTLSLTVGQGVAGNPFALYLVDISGAPANLLLTVATLDSTGRFNLTGFIPPGLSGLTLGFKAFAIDTSGKIIDSGVQTVWFR